MDNAQNVLEEKKPRISKDSAKASVQKLLDFYNVEFDHIVNDLGKEAAKTWFNKMAKAFQDERIETHQSDKSSEGFQIIQHLKNGKAITYNEYNFKAAREYAKQKDSASGNFSLLGSLSGKSMDYFEGFSGPDLRLAEQIVLIFFF